MTQQVLSIISICFCFSAFSQKAEVILSSTKINVEVGETIVFKTESNIEGTSQIDNIPSSFNNSGSISTGMNYQMDYNTGDVLVIYTYTETGSFSKPGTYKIGPAYIKSRTGKAYQSNMITINVAKKIHLNNGQISAQQRSEPAFGVIQTSKSSIFEGESIVVGAKVYSRFQPSRIGNYNTFIQRKGIEFQTLTNTSRQLKIREEYFKGTNYFTLEYDRNLVFPSGTGLFILDPFTMDVIQGFKGFSLRSNGATVEIKPLPGNAPNDFIGAVGEFIITRMIDTNRVKQGDVFKLIIGIEGIGNIQNSLEPELNLPKGLIVYGDPIINKDISYGVNGAEGTISYEFNIQVSTKGKVRIPGTSISYFDPITAQYVTVKSPCHSVYVVKDVDFIAANTKPSVADEAIYTHNAADIRLKKEVRSTKSIFGTPLFWSGVSAPLVCAFFFVFFVRRREQSADEIESKQAIQQKDKELHSFVVLSKSLLASGENDAYYSSIERALRKAFECKMEITDTERILSKDEIYSYLKASDQHELIVRVRALFTTCEESRFGFGLSNDLRQPAFNQLESILKALKV
ncbi:MAG: hypothetical protein COA38_03920 [Fluviicola sp.]|nr:MAG: hypothetical protein COA38_03920 [Fluviicola sp.]